MIYIMAHTISREKDADIDLESGRNTSAVDASKSVTSREGQSNNGFRLPWNGIANNNVSNKHEHRVESSCSSAKSDDMMDENLELLVGRDIEGEHVQEKLSLVDNSSTHKNKKTRPSKPPRPPKGPSLDAADQKFVKEIVELALRKRDRIKRVKAVKKMKASNKSLSSSCTGLFAMFITLFVFLILILLGIISGSSAAYRLMASPGPAAAAEEGLISVQYPKNFITSEGVAPGSHYPALQDR